MLAARRINWRSLPAGPSSEMPNGAPCTSPSGTVICGQPSSPAIEVSVNALLRYVSSSSYVAIFSGAAEGCVGMTTTMSGLNRALKSPLKWFWRSRAASTFPSLMERA